MTDRALRQSPPGSRAGPRPASALPWERLCAARNAGKPGGTLWPAGGLSSLLPAPARSAAVPPGRQGAPAGRGGGALGSEAGPGRSMAGSESEQEQEQELELYSSAEDDDYVPSGECWRAAAGRAVGAGAHCVCLQVRSTARMTRASW